MVLKKMMPTRSHIIMKTPVLLILGLCLLTSLCTPAFSEKPLRFFFEKTATTESAPLPAYTVRSGDWLIKILVQHGYTQAEIARMMPAIQDLNPHIADLNALRPGQALYLPPRPARQPGIPAPEKKATSPSSLVHKPYVVRAGDTLTSVLQQQGIPAALIYSKYVAQFKELNPEVNNTDALRAGQHLLLPLVDPADLGLIAAMPTRATSGKATGVLPPPVSVTGTRPVLLPAPWPANATLALNATSTHNATLAEPPATAHTPFIPTNATSSTRQPDTGLNYVRTVLKQMRFTFVSGDEEMYPTPGGAWLHVNLHETPLATTPWGKKVIFCPIPKSADWTAKAASLGMQLCSVPADWALPATLTALARAYPDQLRVWEQGRELSLSRKAMGLTVSAPLICIVQQAEQQRVHILWSRHSQEERPLPQDLPEVLHTLDVHIIELDHLNSLSRLPAKPRQAVYVPQAAPLDILRTLRLENAEQITGPTLPTTLGALLHVLRSHDMLRQGVATMNWAAGTDRRLSLHVPAWLVGPAGSKVILIDRRFSEPALVSLLAQEGYSCFVLPPSF